MQTGMANICISIDNKGLMDYLGTKQNTNTNTTTITGHEKNIQNGMNKQS